MGNWTPPPLPTSWAFFLATNSRLSLYAVAIDYIDYDLLFVAYAMNLGAACRLGLGKVTEWNVSYTIF